MHKKNIAPCSPSKQTSTNYNDIMRRIASVTGTHTQAALAAALGIRQSSISDAKRRGTIPAEWYLRLFDTLGVNPDWLKKEIGPIFLRTEAGYLCTEPDVAQTESVMVTVYNPERILEATPATSATPPLPGAVLWPLESCGRMAVPGCYACPGLLVLHTRTDAFAPLIRKGAHVGIDTRQTHPCSGDIYAVLAPHEGVVLRRLYLLEQKDGFILRADNPAYPENRLAAAECGRRLIGRLTWIMQTL